MQNLMKSFFVIWVREMKLIYQRSLRDTELLICYRPICPRFQRRLSHWMIFTKSINLEARDLILPTEKVEKLTSEWNRPTA